MKSLFLVYCLGLGVQVGVASMHSAHHHGHTHRGESIVRMAL